MARSLKIDVMCKVVDNFGDIGFCWRLCRELSNMGHELRLFCDRIDVLSAIIQQNLTPKMNFRGVEVYSWDFQEASAIEVDLVIEAYGCGLLDSYRQSAWSANPKLWIVLDYLALEGWAKDCHGLRSPSNLHSCVKYFYFPGLDDCLGGVLADASFKTLKQSVESDLAAHRDSWLGRFGYKLGVGSRWFSLFAYQHSWRTFFLDLQESSNETVVWIPAGYALEWAKNNLEEMGFLPVGGSWVLNTITVCPLPFLAQEHYQELLLLCDFSVVRGEDSFVLALLSSKPFLWHAYCQADWAHMDKVTGFVQTLQRYLPSDHLPYLELLQGFNQREVNRDDLDLQIDYSWLFENLTEIQESFEKLSLDAWQRWDLMSKLTNFVDEHLALSANQSR